METERLPAQKVLFTDETYFFIQGQQIFPVRRHKNEKVKKDHIRQTVKHPVKNSFGMFSADMDKKN